MGRRPCCAKEGLNRGAWTGKEDEVLTSYIKIHGEGKWRDLPQRAGLMRCGKSCRLRWLNYLRPDIKRGNISTEEEELIVRLHKLLGNRWSLIAGRLPGRTDNEIKNYWNTNLSKRVQGLKNNNNNICRTTQASPNIQLNKLRKLGSTTGDEHKVIRTKAVKCTKAVNVNIPTPVFDNQGAENNLGPKSDESTIACSESPSSSAIDNKDNPIDFLIDFDINELLASDAPIPDFHQIQQVDENGDNVVENGEYGNGNFNLYIDEVDHQLYSPADEARPDNRRDSSDHLFQTSETLDLRSLASYLNLEDEWIH